MIKSTASTAPRGTISTTWRRGVYLGGGIAPKIVEKLKGPTFIEAFLAKGRMRPLLEAIPVRVIMREGTALVGAARYAAELEDQ